MMTQGSKFVVLWKASHSNPSLNKRDSDLRIELGRQFVKNINEKSREASIYISYISTTISKSIEVITQTKFTNENKKMGCV